MNTLSSHSTDLPPEQQAIRAKCFHPTGTFIEFKKEDIEQSIPDRFEEEVDRYPNRLAVKTGSEQLTYDELNKAANQVAQAILAQMGAENEPIALLFEHGVPAITAILGVLKAGKIYVPLEGLIDLGEEIAKQSKNLEGLKKRLKSVSAKLSNEKFTNNAPEDVVAQQRALKEQVESQLADVQAVLEELKTSG